MIAVELAVGDDLLQRRRLARSRARCRRQRGIDRLDRRALRNHQIEIPDLAVGVPECIHFRHLLAGIDVDDRERHMPEEGLLGQPHQDVGVLADRPEHRQTVDAIERLAQECRCSRSRSGQGGPTKPRCLHSHAFEAADPQGGAARHGGGDVLSRAARSGNSSCGRACHAVSGERSRFCRSRTVAPSACAATPGLRGTR